MHDCPCHCVGETGGTSIYLLYLQFDCTGQGRSGQTRFYSNNDLAKYLDLPDLPPSSRQKEATGCTGSKYNITTAPCVENTVDRPCPSLDYRYQVLDYSYSYSHSHSYWYELIVHRYCSGGWHYYRLAAPTRRGFA